MRHKKAMQIMSMEFLLGLIIVIILLLILLVFYTKTAQLSKARNIPEQCRKNIEINAIGNIAGMQLYDDVKCPTEYLSIEKTEPDEIKETAAEALTSCWYKMGEGQYEVFDTTLFSHSFERSVQYCVVCSVLEFDSAPQTIEGFLNYMDENQAPVLYTKKHGMSYTTYLQGFQSDQSLQLLYDQETDDVIDTTSDYAVLFLYAKKGYINKIWSSAAGAGVGFTVGAVLVFTGVGIPAGLLIAGGTVAGTAGGYAIGSTETADWDSGILLYPYETEALKKLDCDILPVKQ